MAIPSISSTSAVPSSAFTGLVIGLASSFGSILLIAIIIFIFWVSGCAGSGRIILDRLGRPGEFDDEQAFLREEAEALETMDDMTRQEYLRAKAFIVHNPPESAETEISLSQFLAIQEKGVSAWEFEPELEIANCFVEARTEIEFFDSECTVLTNLPVPKQNDVYYWEAKVYEKPDTTLLSIGMATKPYPLFRLPGFHKYSVAYQSTGHRRYNQPFSATPYGPQLVQGDVVGIGYRPRTGAIFFTRNGKKLDEVVHGLKAQNFFPAIGANGPAIVHVNFGQAGFVFIEANVKKWGLAPVTGSLAPPPPYGSEQGSILLETGNKDGFVGSQHHPQHPHHYQQNLVHNHNHPYHPHHQQQQAARAHSHSINTPPYNVINDRHPGSASFSISNNNSQSLSPQEHRRTRSGNFRLLPPINPGPVRSPTDISLAQLAPSEDNGEGSSTTVTIGSRPDRHIPNSSNDNNNNNSLHLHLEDATNPPPGYASPDNLSQIVSRPSTPTPPTTSTTTPLTATRHRSSSVVTAYRDEEPGPPVPTYSDAVRYAAGGSIRDSSPPSLITTPRRRSTEDDYNEDEDEYENIHSDDSDDL